MAYLVVLLFAFAEATAVIGLVVPGTTAVAAAGSAARLGKINYWGVVIAAVVGAFGGDAASYMMGLWLHRWKLLERWLAKHREKVEEAEQVVRRWGMLGVIFGRFFAPTRSFVPLIAGSMRMPAVQFTVANAIGAVAWAFVTVEVGEEGVEFYERLPRKWSIILLAAGAIAWAGWILSRRIAARRKRLRGSSAGIPP